MYVELWGRHAWYYLHNISYQRDERYLEPKLIQKFIELLGNYIPCPGCKKHFKENYISTSIKFEDAIINIDLLGDYFVDIHNLVNQHNHLPIYNYVVAKELVSNKNAYHNGMLFLTSIIFILQDKCLLTPDILEITKTYTTNHEVSINMLSRYMNSSNNSKEKESLEKIFIKKSYAVNFLEKTRLQQDKVIEETKQKLISLEMDEYKEYDEIENTTFLISFLNDLLHVNKEEKIKQELYRGLDIFFINIDELLEFIYLFGYLLPDKPDRDIFIQIYDAHKIYLRNAIINENIFTDWLIPFINNVNINTEKMFYLDPLNIVQFRNRLLNMLGNDYGDNQ